MVSAQPLMKREFINPQDTIMSSLNGLILRQLYLANMMLRVSLRLKRPTFSRLLDLPEHEIHSQTNPQDE